MKLQGRTLYFCCDGSRARNHSRFLQISALDWLILLVFLLLIQFNSPACAQKPPNLTGGEVSLLPKYCPDTMGVRESSIDFYAAPQTQYWFGLMGKSFSHMHHYCWALVKVKRAMMPGVSPMLRRSMISNAIADHDYVVRNSPPNFIMLPEVYSKMGEAYILNGDAGNALTAFTHAIALKPDYAPPYDRWAETLEQTGNKKAALAFLENGLKYNPDSALLQAHYKRLGGSVAPSPKVPASAASTAPQIAAMPDAAASPAAAAASN